MSLVSMCVIMFCYVLLGFVFFFFKQKTAYEMRISDWSSDVCSSDLDRPAAARLLLDAGCDVLVADDGLQHYRLARDVEVCVIDGVRRFGNRRLLPAGPLREPLRRLQEVDLRVCNGGDAQDGEYPMQLRGGDVVALTDGRTQALADFSGQRVHAVAAIGN